MREVGIFEAKTHLSELLAAVEAGETITITKRGRPLAVLGPASDQAQQRRQALSELKALKAMRGDAVSVAEILAFRDEGRR